jgi:F-type H+-transporting ATPase subunit gamma
MKLVAAARLRRAQEAILAARPYSDRLGEVIADVASRVATGDAHPLLQQREEVKKVALVVITSDRGLCGGFNSNLIRRTERFLVDNQDKFNEVALYLVGRKGRDYFRRRKLKMVRDWPAAQTGDAALALAREIVPAVTELFLGGEYDAVYLVYNEFKSAITQRAAVEPLLPVRVAPVDESYGLNDFKYEPSREELLTHLVPLHLEVQVYRAVLESIASEFGARMSAMDSATRNASDMISNLTLQANRARQASITKELMEIIGGAEALKG